MANKRYFSILWTKSGDLNTCRRLAQYEWIRRAGDCDLNRVEQALLDASDDFYREFHYREITTTDDEPRDHLSIDAAADIIEARCRAWDDAVAASKAEKKAREDDAASERKIEIENYEPHVERAKNWLSEAARQDHELLEWGKEGHPLNSVIKQDEWKINITPLIGWEGLSDELTADLKRICQTVQEAGNRAIDAAAEAAKQKDEKEIEARNCETNWWITTYGSERLKMQLEHGYNINSRYVKERLQREFGDLGQFALKSKAAEEWAIGIDPEESLLKLEAEVAGRLADIGIATDLTDAIDNYTSIRKSGETGESVLVFNYRPGKSKRYNTYTVVLIPDLTPEL